VSARAVPPSAHALAGLLLEHLHASGTLSVEDLAVDPFTALADDPSLRVVWVAPETLPAECSIAAACDKTTSPARLLISDDASAGRRRFSVLHEYAHLLRDRVPALLQALFAISVDAGAALEERVCDEFASQVLLPDTLLDSVIGEHVTARSVLSLIAAAPASAEACAVAATRKLPAPGYVMLLAPDGTATFTDHNRDVYRVRRGSGQVGLLARAAAGQTVRGREQVRYSTGNLSGELFLDAAAQDNRTVAILVTDSPPWGGLTAGHKQGAQGTNGYCENCAHDFTTFSRVCANCGQPACPQCGQCGCETNAGVAGELRCDRCYLVLPPAAFSTGSRICTECS
jgi:hypothetical protein